MLRLHAVEQGAEAGEVVRRDREVEANRAVLRACVRRGVDEVLLARRARSLGGAVEREQSLRQRRVVEPVPVQQSTEHGRDVAGAHRRIEVDAAPRQCLAQRRHEREAVERRPDLAHLARVLVAARREPLERRSIEIRLALERR